MLNCRHEQTAGADDALSLISAATASQSEVWIDQELAAANSAMSDSASDFESFLSSSPMASARSIPWVCQDWANTKAAYRFLSQRPVSEAEILAGHFLATRDRFVGHRGPVLILHDTTEFSYHREDVGCHRHSEEILHRPDKAGRLRHYTVCGILMHSSLAVTTARAAAGSGGHQVLDPRQISGLQRAEEEDQSDARAHRKEGEHPLAGEPDASPPPF